MSQMHAVRCARFVRLYHVCDVRRLNARLRDMLRLSKHLKTVPLQA